MRSGRVEEAAQQPGESDTR